MVQYLIFFEHHFQCFDDLVQRLEHTENNYHHYFFGFIVALLIFEQSGDLMYDLSLFKLVL